MPVYNLPSKDAVKGHLNPPSPPQSLSVHGVWNTNQSFSIGTPCRKHHPVFLCWGLGLLDPGLGHQSGPGTSPSGKSSGDRCPGSLPGPQLPNWPGDLSQVASLLWASICQSEKRRWGNTYRAAHVAVIPRTSSQTPGAPGLSFCRSPARGVRSRVFARKKKLMESVHSLVSFQGRSGLLPMLSAATAACPLGIWLEGADIAWTSRLDPRARWCDHRR